MKAEQAFLNLIFELKNKHVVYVIYMAENECVACLLVSLFIRSFRKVWKIIRPLQRSVQFDRRLFSNVQYLCVSLKFSLDTLKNRKAVEPYSSKNAYRLIYLILL